MPPPALLTKFKDSLDGATSVQDDLATQIRKTVEEKVLSGMHQVAEVLLLLLQVQQQPEGSVNGFDVTSDVLRDEVTRFPEEAMQHMPGGSAWLDDVNLKASSIKQQASSKCSIVQLSFRVVIFQLAGQYQALSPGQRLSNSSMMPLAGWQQLRHRSPRDSTGRAQGRKHGACWQPAVGRACRRCRRPQQAGGRMQHCKKACWCNTHESHEDKASQEILPDEAVAKLMEWVSGVFCWQSALPTAWPLLCSSQPSQALSEPDFGRFWDLWVGSNAHEFSCLDSETTKLRDALVQRVHSGCHVVLRDLLRPFMKFLAAVVSGEMSQDMFKLVTAHEDDAQESTQEQTKDLAFCHSCLAVFGNRAASSTLKVQDQADQSLEEGSQVFLTKTATVRKVLEDRLGSGPGFPASAASGSWSVVGVRVSGQEEQGLGSGIVLPGVATLGRFFFHFTAPRHLVPVRRAGAGSHSRPRLLLAVDGAHREAHGGPARPVRGGQPGPGRRRRCQCCRCRARAVGPQLEGLAGFAPHVQRWQQRHSRGYSVHCAWRSSMIF